MEEVTDIRFELRFVGSERFPARLLLGTIEAVERAILRAEIQEIDEIEKAFPDLPAAVFDAMRYRADRLTAQSLNFETASSGSIILGGVAAAVAYWLLDKTLGETVKQAWEGAELHKRIKGFLLTNMTPKANRIAQDIRPSRWSNSDGDLTVETVAQEQAILIVVTITVPSELAPIPPASEVRRIHNDGDA
jgi:hypothetical protein